MTDMIERVARAMDDMSTFYRFDDWSDDYVDGCPNQVCRYGDGDTIEVQASFQFIEDAEDYLRQQRAALVIKAMREHTDEMIEAGKGQYDFPEDVWVVMIDAALGDKK